MLPKLFAALLVLLLSAYNSSPDSSEKAIDTCRLFAADDLAIYVGNELNKGLPTGVGHSCQYRPKNADGTSVLLTVEPDVSVQRYEKSKSSLENVQPVNSLPNAFSYSSNRLENAGADAMVIDRRLRVLLDGPGATSSKAELLLTDMAVVLGKYGKG